MLHGALTLGSSPFAAPQKLDLLREVFLAGQPRHRAPLPTPGTGQERAAQDRYNGNVLQVTKHQVVPVTYVGMGATAQDRDLAEALGSFRGTLHEDQRAGRKTVIILDLRRSTVLTTSQRWMTAMWMKEVTPLFMHTTFGTVFIVESALMRGVLMALLWVQPKGTPYAIVADLNEAVHWAFECMDGANISLSSEVRKSLEASLQDELARVYRNAA